MIDMDFSTRLHDLRVQRELSMDMLVLDLNTRFGLRLNKGTISRWESGQGDPAISYVKCIAAYFNVSVDYLIGLTDVSTPARLLAYSRKLYSKEEAQLIEDVTEHFERKED